MGGEESNITYLVFPPFYLLRLIHGLLHCKNGCGSWNRDRNGSSNIYKIAKNVINNIDRPSYLCRETSNQSTSTSAYNQTLRRYEKT